MQLFLARIDDHAKAVFFQKLSLNISGNVVGKHRYQCQVFFFRLPPHFLLFCQFWKAEWMTVISTYAIHSPTNSHTSRLL